MIVSRQQSNGDQSRQSEPIARLAPAPPSTETTALPPPLLVDAHEAARLLCICEKSLWTLTAPRGPIPCLRIGRAVRYDVGDLRAWIDSAKLSAKPGGPADGNLTG